MLENFKLKFGQNRLEKPSAVHALVQKLTDRAGLLNSGFDLVDHIVGRAGHELDEISARGAHALVGIDENTQRTGRRDLLALDKILRDILGDLARNELDASYIRLLHPKVPDDGEHAVIANGCAHIELSSVLFKKADLRVIDIAAHVAFRVGDGQKRSQGAAALYLQGDRAVFRFLHIAHHGSRAQEPPERCRRRGKQLMNLPRALDDTGRGDRNGVHKAVFCHRAGNLILHNSILSSLRKKCAARPLPALPAGDLRTARPAQSRRP